MDDFTKSIVAIKYNPELVQEYSKDTPNEKNRKNKSVIDFHFMSHHHSSSPDLKMLKK